MSESAYSFDVTSENLQTAVVDASRERPVLLDFWASWCGPCKMLMPILEKLVTEYDGQILLGKVNIDEQQELATQFGVRSVPTVKLFRGGEVVDEFLGAQPEGTIRALIDPHIERASDREMEEARRLQAQGQTGGAIEKAHAAAASDPGNIRVQLGLAELLMTAGEYGAAEAVLRGLPADIGASDGVSQLFARLEFARTASDAPPAEVLEQRIAADARDSEARYQLAARLLVSGRYPEAMDQLLELLRRDRTWGNEAGRRGLVKVFEILGDSDERVGRYRRLMFNALH